MSRQGPRRKFFDCRINGNRQVIIAAMTNQCSCREIRQCVANHSEMAIPGPHRVGAMVAMADQVGVMFAICELGQSSAFGG
jgi:hypothetical protein